MIRTLILTAAIMLFAGCAGTNFNYSDARLVQAGMTTAEVVKIMKAEPNVTEVKGNETHFVWAYGNLAGVAKQVRVRFDASGKVIAPPVIPN